MDSSPQRLVVFGCGYVGSAVARWAVARGWHVTALTRNPRTAAWLEELGAAPIVADLASDTWHAAIAGAPAFALNCVSSGGGGLEGYRHSYLAGMESIAAWSQSRGAPGTVVYTSSTSVYPQGGGARVDETAPTDGASDRGQILLAAEAVLRTRVACRRWFVLRLAGIYGPDRHHLLEQIRTGVVAGSGDHRLNLIHRDDIVGAIAACFEAPAEVPGGVFNVADDGAAPKREIVAWLAARLGLPSPTFSGEPAGGRRAVTPDRVIDASRARGVLGWRPTYSTFREGYGSLLSR